MVRSQNLKDTTTQHITTHMHGYKKVYHLITACMCVGIYSYSCRRISYLSLLLAERDDVITFVKITKMEEYISAITVIGFRRCNNLI